MTSEYIYKVTMPYSEYKAKWLSGIYNLHTKQEPGKRGKMVKSKAFIISVDYDEDMNGNFDIDKVVIENALAFYFDDLPTGMIKKIEVTEMGYMDLDLDTDPLEID